MKTMKEKIIFLIGIVWLALAIPGGAQNDYPPGVNYDSDQAAGITIRTENIELSKLIKLLSVQERANIISSCPLEGTVTVNLYNVTLEQVLDAVLIPNQYAYRVMNNVYLVMRAEELERFDHPPAPLETRLFRLNYLNLIEAEKFITPLLSDRGQMIVGEKPVKGIQDGDTGGDASASSNVVLVQDQAEVLNHIEEILKELDVRPVQVLVEATILEAILDDRCVLGVDFNALGGIDFSDLNSTSNLFSITPEEASGNQLDDTLFAAGTAGFAADEPSEGFSFGILHEKVGLFIEAMENVVDTNVIANPKVIALNRQRAEIIIGGRLGYYGTETVNQGISQQNVEFLDTGIQLRFRPYISPDGFVRLEIQPGRSSGVVDTVTGLPSETTSEVTTNILVKDGDTVVIGGLIEESDTLQEKRVPLLGSLPLVGWLFRREETQTKRTEIIVLITPHILKPGSENPEAEEEIRAFKQRKRLFREGFPFYSRTLYAQRHVDKARVCLQEEDGPRILIPTTKRSSH
jgi:type IV pilus secretin PilQ/predicted competence protein